MDKLLVKQAISDRLYVSLTTVDLSCMTDFFTEDNSDFCEVNVPFSKFLYTAPDRNMAKFNGLN